MGGVTGKEMLHVPQQHGIQPSRCSSDENESRYTHWCQRFFVVCIKNLASRAVAGTLPSADTSGGHLVDCFPWPSSSGCLGIDH
jgi:hypothetical protein